MKIDHERSEAAYRLGLERHKGRIGIAEARRRLEAIGLNPNSGADLVYNVSHLLNGKSYTRMLSVPVTDDFLSWIRRDFGIEGLANAVSALGKHIVYYETLRKTRVPKLRSVLAKHREKLQAVDGEDEAAILFEWRDSESRGYVDVLPLRWFENAKPKLAVVHDVRSRDEERTYQAKCNITLNSGFADLDYEAFEAFNAQQEMLPGVARLHFADVDRTSIIRVEWKPKGRSKFKDCPFDSSSFQQPPDPPYVPPKSPEKKKVQLVRERPGQAKFRRKLKAAYGDRCCMTGCSIPEALEGAHIDEYRTDVSNNIRNGLLLRRDIHALFDRDLIAIEPETNLIHVSDPIRTETGYRFLHGTPLKRPFQSEHYPDPNAMLRRWKRYLAKST